MPTIHPRTLAEDVVALDVRSLSLFRVALGAALLTDLACKTPQLAAFFTDDGLLTRVAAGALPGGGWTWAPHFWSGGLLLPVLLHVVALVAALCLLLGYRTRVAQVACWVLVASMHARNPLILDRGDAFLRLALFWSIPLDLSRFFSVDAHQSGPTRAGPLCLRVANVFTVAYVGQLVVAHLFTALHRSGGAWTQDGSALFHLLSMQELAHPMAQGLTAYPEVLAGLTFGLVGLRTGAPLLLLLPWPRPWVRVASLSLLAGLEVLAHFLFAVGLAPFHALVALLPLMPSAFWDNPGRRDDRPCTRQAPAAVGAWLLLFLLCVAGNVASLPRSGWRLPGWARGVLQLTRLEQRWDEWAPAPPRRTTWWVVEAEYEDGRRYDLLTFKRVDFEAPEDVQGRFPTRFHRRLLHLLRRPRNGRAWPYVARGFWRQGVEASPAGTQLERLRIHRLTRPNRPHGEEPAPIERTMVYGLARRQPAAVTE